MSISIDVIKEAQRRIAPYAVCTPLFRMQNLDRFLGCRVYVKAECMQITGSFKLRGALNKMLSLSEEELSRGIVAVSSGNHGRAVAYVAGLLGAKAAIVMPRTAPAVKLENIRALGAEIILCDAAERFQVGAAVCEERGATLIPPYNDEAVMAGQGTCGLEIAEQAPDLDMLIVPVSGGGLLSGVSAAVRACAPQTILYGAEPEGLPRYSASLAAGRPVKVERHPSLADALLSDTPGALCFPVIRENVHAVCPVSDEYLARAMKLLLTEGKLFAEPSACIGIGAVLQGLIPVSKTDRVCFLVSGGNAGLDQLSILENV